MKVIKVKNSRIDPSKYNPTPPLLNYFNHDKIRPYQLKVLSILYKYYEQYDYIFIEAQTGFGKSAIVDAVARWRVFDHNERVIITVNRKQLLKQYEQKYNHFLFMGKNEYPCLATPHIKDIFGNGKQVSADLGICTFISDFDCPFDPRRHKELYTANTDMVCPYYRRKWIASKSPLLTTSSLGLLYNLEDIGNRHLLIWDEADSSFEDFIKFYTLSINEEYYFKKYRIRFNPERATEPAYWKAMIPSLVDEINNEVQTLLEEKLRAKTEKKKDILAYKITLLRKEIENLNNIRLRLNDTKNLIIRVNIPEETNPNSPNFMTIEFVPLILSSVPSYKEFKAHLGNKIIFIGATLFPELLIQQLELDPERAIAIKIMKHPFPPENRRIIFIPTGKMSRNSKDKTLPFLLKAIADILDYHSNEAGLILPNSFWLKNEIISYLLDYDDIIPRIITHEASQKSILHAIDKWNASDNGILISTYLKHGFDGSHGSFIIIPKVPFPTLTDEWVKQRKKKLPYGDLEYKWKAIKDIIQMQGRSTRSKDDKSVIYILDSDFAWLYRNNSALFPDWFKEALTIVPYKDFQRIISNYKKSKSSSHPSVSTLSQPSS